MHSKISSLEMGLNVCETTKIWCLCRTPQPHIFISCFVELVLHGCAPVGSSSWIPSSLWPTATSIKSGLRDAQLQSWHCNVGWVRSGLCCAYSRLLLQELEVIPISCLEEQHRLTLRLWTVMECPHLVTCVRMHQNLINWFE